MIYVLQYVSSMKKALRSKQEVDDHLQEKKVIYVAKETALPESNLRVIIKSDSKKPNHLEDLQEKRQQVLITPQARKIHARTYRRSKSEITKRVVIDERKNIVRWPSETDQKHEPDVEENDQFSTMSNEELNKRFEDFIQRFNRQIRLQGTRNFRPNLK
jgi:G3E family GTPase